MRNDGLGLLDIFRESHKAGLQHRCIDGNAGGLGVSPRSCGRRAVPHQSSAAHPVEGPAHTRPVLQQEGGIRITLLQLAPIGLFERLWSRHCICLSFMQHERWSNGAKFSCRSDLEYILCNKHTHDYGAHPLVSSAVIGGRDY